MYASQCRGLYIGRYCASCSRCLRSNSYWNSWPRWCSKWLHVACCWVEPPTYRIASYLTSTAVITANLLHLLLSHQLIARVASCLLDILVFANCRPARDRLCAETDNSRHTAEEQKKKAINQSNYCDEPLLWQLLGSSNRCTCTITITKNTIGVEN